MFALLGPSSLALAMVRLALFERMAAGCRIVVGPDVQARADGLALRLGTRRPCVLLNPLSGAPGAGSR